MAKEKTIICFDMDGTLFTSNEAQVASFNKAFEKNNLEVQTSRDLIAKFGMPSITIIREFFPNIPERKIQKVAKDKTNFMARETYALIKPIPGTREALEELKEKYYVAVISNSTHEEIILTLKQAGLSARFFDAIACAQEVEHGKPAPDEIFKVEKKLKAKAEYMVGDTIYDMQAGKAAGIKTVAVLTGVHDIVKLGEENPTLIVESVAVLPDVLSGRL